MSSPIASSSALQLRQANGSASLHSYTSDLKQSDALPYFDREIETQPGLQGRVEREIQNEMAKLKKVDESRLPPSLNVFTTRPTLLSEVERAGKGDPLKAIDTLRFQLPAPEAGLKASEEEWVQAVNNAATQLVHQEGRLTNLELLKRYGANHWRLHNFQQEAFLKQYEQATDAVLAQSTTLNRKRRQDQTAAGEKISTLERKWTELISRGLQLEVANISAQYEVQALQEEEEQLRVELARMEQE